MRAPPPRRLATKARHNSVASSSASSAPHPARSAIAGSGSPRTGPPSERRWLIAKDPVSEARPQDPERAATEIRERGMHLDTRAIDRLLDAGKLQRAGAPVQKHHLAHPARDERLNQ